MLATMHLYPQRHQRQVCGIIVALSNERDSAVPAAAVERWVAGW